MATRKKAAPKVARGRKSFAYEDLPGRRHRELIQDRRFGSEGQNLAKFRLAAIRERMASALRLTAPGMSTPVSPEASNWVQLGPMAIPNGQTYGGARVLV